MGSRNDHSQLSSWGAAAVLLLAYAAPSPGGPPAPVKGDTASASASAHPAGPANDYPTYVRVQYVEQCMGRNGRSEAALYKCSCAIDRIAARLTYDQFVEASTYAQYATLGGENAGIFRDHPLAQQRAKLLRTVESAAWRACALPPPAQ
jgi:hypothetical protein